MGVGGFQSGLGLFNLGVDLIALKNGQHLSLGDVVPFFHFYVDDSTGYLGGYIYLFCLDETPLGGFLRGTTCGQEEKERTQEYPSNVFLHF